MYRITHDVPEKNKFQKKNKQKNEKKRENTPVPELGLVLRLRWSRAALRTKRVYM